MQRSPVGPCSCRQRQRTWSYGTPSMHPKSFVFAEGLRQSCLARVQDVCVFSGCRSFFFKAEAGLGDIALGTICRDPRSGGTMGLRHRQLISDLLHFLSSYFS